MVKNPIMTYFYGSGILTRCQSYEDAFMEQCIEKKIYITKSDILNFRKFCTYIDHRLRKWVSNVLPEARLLYKVFYYVGKNKTLEPPILTSSHIMWKYAPHQTIKRSKTLARKVYKIALHGDELDWNKISSGFLANYIQSKDAIICSKIVTYLRHKNIPIISTHDCWKVPYHHAKDLHLAILNAYTEFFNENHLENDFNTTPIFPIYKYFVETAEGCDFTLLDPNNFCLETMAKP